MKTMKTMKNYLILVLTVVGFFAVTSCNKIDSTDQSLGSQGVSFSITPGANLGNLKSTDTINCYTVTADYVKATIDDSTYKIDVFYINGSPYSNTLKLNPGTHMLKEFTLWSDNNTPNNTADDIMLAATPHAGSAYAPYVISSLNIPFVVESFKKVELPVEVVCYEEDHFSNFGFTYFQISQVVIREETFFGDICIKQLSDYTGSLYAQQSNGLQLDMPAIAKIEVYRNGILQQTFSNEAWKGEGQPLKVTYGDYLNEVDHFEFKLYILVRKDAGFSYVYFHSWTFDDAQVIPQGTDGIVDFVLGNCVPGADLVIPPWMNLPSTCTYQITGNYAPGAKGGYVDASLTGFNNVYDITTGLWASFCADHATNINTSPYSMTVYSSLYQNKLPVFAQSTKWAKINWIMNHLDWYPGYKWYDLQGAIWLFDVPAWTGVAEGGVPAISTMQWAQKMHDDANTYGDNYKVPSGGWASVIFIPAGTPGGQLAPTVQTMFVRVDP